MKENVKTKKNAERTFAALMAIGLLIPAENLSLFAAQQPNYATQLLEAKDLTTLSNKELASLANPIVQSYQADNQQSIWRVDESTRIVVLANQENLENERLTEVVKLVNAEFVDKGVISSPLAMVYANLEETTANDVVVTIDAEKTKSISDSEEAYQIIINDQGVQIIAASENAVMYAIRTIQNYMVSAKGMISGTIEDFPDVAERRMHVDCARKYISKDWFIREIREMSYLKMNTIQIHFSENMGFRIECETDPAIVSDQYLTKAEVREILAEAKKYGIKVIPSFDTPGHVDQILKAHPEYGQISNKGTHFASGIDITNPKAIEYIRSLYSEYMELFKDSTDFHIGGDEYMEFDRNPFRSDYKSVLDDYAKANIDPNATWKDTVANYINELAEFVQEKGFKPRIFNDGIYYGENSYSEKPQMIKMHDYIGIDFWSQMTWNRDIANLNTFVNKGHKDIYNMNASFFYYVLRNDKPTDGREQHSFDYIDQERRIFEEWTPGKFQSNTVADDSDFIKGASMGIWCDKGDLVEEDVITEDIADELRSLATKAWNTESNSITTLTNFQKNYALLGHTAGWEKGSELPEVPDILPADSLGKVTIQFVSDTGEELKKDAIHYGTIGKDYSFRADEIYGYRLVSEANIAGTYHEDGDVYTFVYESYCDKSTLEKEVQQSLNTIDYIRETVSDYENELINATAVLNDENSMQWDVDEAYQQLMEAKKKTVKLAYYPLYVEVMYPLTDIGYTNGYTAYQTAIEQAKGVLFQEEVTAEQIKMAFDNIDKAKAGLMRPDGMKIKVTADPYYVDPNKGESFYNYDKMLDGDAATKCWFKAEQVAGHEVLFTFPRTLNMSAVRIVQPSNVGDDAINGADIEVAEVLGEWHKVGDITQSELDYTASFEEMPVQYVRVKLTKNKVKYWYQIQDMFFTYEQPKEDHTLRDMIKEAQELDLTGKSAKRVSSFVDVLIEAQKAYVKQNGDTEVYERDLRNAIDMIMTDDGKGELQNLYDTYSKVENYGYTEASWNAFTTALNEAKQVLDNEEAGTEEIQNAVTNLQVAYDSLEQDVTVAKAILKGAITKVENADLDTLAPSVATMMRAKLAEAKAVLNNEKATNEDYLKAWLNLADAMHYLDFKADKSDLGKLIAECVEINLGDYTIGVVEFEEALANAQAVYENDNVLQTSIDEAFKQLDTARNGLMKGEVNKALLQRLYESIIETVGDGSTYNQKDEAWKIFSEAMIDAKAIIDDNEASQDMVNMIFTKLANAYVDIRLLPDEALLKDLQSFIDLLEGVDLTQFSIDQRTYITDVKTRAIDMLAKPDAITQTDKEQIRKDIVEVKLILENGDKILSDPATTKPESSKSQDAFKGQSKTALKVNERKTSNIAKTGDKVNIGIPVSTGIMSLIGLYLLKKRRK